ncbi:ABC transporter permease [Streptomyces sp. DT24]|uniref:ABC transporter permease n=1 Tax=unclassified Streptomyces TaxID=2593676 RepID=UPI003CEDD0B2
MNDPAPTDPAPPAPTPVPLPVPAPVSAPGDAPATPGILRRAARSLLHDIPALLSVSVLVLLAVAALAAPLLAPHDPLQTFAEGLSDRGGPAGPSGDFPLGADPNGRDVLSRLLYGARVSLTIGVLANGLATLLGVTVGLVAGYFGGWVESVLMRITDIVMSFPILLFCIVLIAITGPSRRNVILVIAFIYWTALARVIRGLVLSLKEREFITATLTLGVGRGRIILRHILPHLVPAIIVYTTLGVASSILIEASLSFIGVGVPVPDPSWGQMIADGRKYYEIAPWLLFTPGICLIVTVLAFNLAGDWLRDLLDPTAPHPR